MAQTGYTPIQLYYSSTTTNVPLAANLASGELAINITDGKLFYKDNSGVVQTIATKAAVTNVSSISFGSTGLTPNTATTGAVTVAGTLAVASGGTNLTGGTSGGVLYFSSASALASSAALAANAIVLGGGAGAAPATTTTGTGVVTALGVNTGTAGAFVVNGGALGTPSSGTVTNLTGTASININGTVGATTPTTGVFTTVRAQGSSATQDAVLLSGRAGGTSSYAVTLTPTTLTASRTVTFADADINFATGLPVANGGTGLTSGTSGGIPYFSSTSAIASSALLAANALVIGGGAGVAPATTTTGTGVITALGLSVTGSGGIALATSPSFTTPTLGVASATSINKVALTAPATGSTLTIADGKTLTVNNTITLSGTDSTVMTFPSTSQTIAGLGVAQTFTATNTFSQVNYTVNTVTVTSNAGTVPITYRLNNFTNSSAATMTITLATASAVDGQMSIVRIYDFSAASQTISWVNTENSNVTVPTTSNGSTTLPLTVGFMYNSATSKWRCVASA